MIGCCVVVVIVVLDVPAVLSELLLFELLFVELLLELLLEPSDLKPSLPFGAMSLFAGVSVLLLSLLLSPLSALSALSSVFVSLASPLFSLPPALSPPPLSPPPLSPPSPL